MYLGGKLEQGSVAEKTNRFGRKFVWDETKRKKLEPIFAFQAPRSEAQRLRATSAGTRACSDAKLRRLAELNISSSSSHAFYWTALQ